MNICSLAEMQQRGPRCELSRAGDRVGICLSGLDAKLLERGVAAAPGSIRPVTAAVALVRKVR